MTNGGATAMSRRCIGRVKTAPLPPVLKILTGMAMARKLARKALPVTKNVTKRRAVK